jgi:hypothetical protein
VIERDRVFAIGDAQASFDQFVGVLRAHALLDGERLRADVGLVSIGDHFDYGGVGLRARAAEDGARILTWLAAHPRDQVVMLAGNHDLARVGELLAYDDARFVRAQALADRAYHGRPADARAEDVFRAENPALPSAEIVARDFSAFRGPQRDVVRALLDDARMQLAYAHGALLFTHASVTLDEMSALGLAADADAHAIAAALNDALARAWRARGADTAFAVPSLHVPGDGAAEGIGMLYHRASTQPEHAAEANGPVPRRKYHPSRLPALTQVIGHIQDKKSRTLLGLDPSAAQHGRVRTLDVAADGALTYGHGVPAHARTHARVIYIDAGMQHVLPDEYALLDVMAVAERRVR